MPNRWKLPGGKIEFGELTVDAAMRETRAETGEAIHLTSDEVARYSRN
jgi:ADP-ribose pyrophosphatase YjhB (NUDIX family)